MTRDGRADGDAPCIVGVEPGNRRRAEHTDHGDVHCDADMHWPGVRRDEEDAAGEESREHAEADLPRKDMEVRMLAFLHAGTAFLHHLHIHRAAHDGDVITASEIGVSHDGEVRINPSLGRPARADVDGDHLVGRSKMRLPEPLCLLLRRGRNPHLEPRRPVCIEYARRAQCRIVRVHLVHHLILTRADMVECEGEARLCIADDAPSAAERGEC